MRSMFNDAWGFNRDLAEWDVSSVKNMHRMFDKAYYFNQDISSWDVSSVTDMSKMFFEAKAFQQDLSSWDVSRVRYADFCFLGVPALNETYICGWNQYWDGAVCNNYSGATTPTLTATLLSLVLASW
eukprot:CAMPEP_0113649500 /NCGR_PEP_ID=MMETSP0017_2-20120614/26300_1 /TAXON_ID=2856 /ORGANISM="Cylindrotheca closterium" /LENGTH=126 /DNA_ID=CAMNT_0000561873 /DNA_START=29 /DNA_END=406 /DNA_ORIENTATION=+ /assembly_acc=CAM_ASM_000147